MRKVLIALITVIALSALCACGDSVDSDSDNESKSTAKVELVEAGYTVDDNNYAIYAFVIKNVSEDTAFEFTDITATAYDENGEVLATDDQMMNKIQPGETQAFATVMDCNGEKPDKIEFAIDSGDEISPSDDTIKASDFEISGTNERPDEFDGTVVTGTIKNNSEMDTESVAVTAIFRKDGAIVSGETTFVDNLGAGKEKAFEVSGYGGPEHDAYEVYALDWGF